MAVTYTLNGVDYQIDSLTLDEAAEIEDELGITWGDMNPVLSAKQARVILTRFLAREKNGDLDEARRIIGALTVKQFTELLVITEDEPAANGKTAKGGKGSPKASEVPALEVLTS